LLQAFKLLEGDSYPSLPWLVKVVTDLTTLLANRGEILRASINATGIPIEGSRFNAIVDALLTGLNDRFVNKWSDAFTDANILNHDYESDRLALLAAALDPATWVLEQCVSETVASRVRAYLKRLFMDELNRPDPVAAAPADDQDDMDVDGMTH
jgi:hypothetical protein